LALPCHAASDGPAQGDPSQDCKEEDEADSFGGEGIERWL
jgi:hypothetical protein